MAYYLGLDAGGTKTTCALARDHTILARATGGTIKLLRTSTEQAARNLDEMLDAVSAQASVDLRSIDCTCVGLSGSTVPRVANWVHSALASCVGGEILLCGDEEAALDAAFPGAPGVLVVAGTGSNVVARAHTGELIHVGGWGPELADEGSGSWIGKQAVRSIFNSLDRGEAPSLFETITHAWELSDLASLIDRVNQQPGPDYSKLAPLVFDCAQRGDLDARQILQQAGSELGRLAGWALRRCQAADPADQADQPDQPDPAHKNVFDVAYTGSVLEQIAPVREAMCAAIRQEFPSVRIQEKAVHAVEGALWRARHHHQSSTPPLPTRG